MMCMTLDHFKPTQFNVIQTIHCNVGLKCFYQNVYSFVLLSYFIYISQSSVETHLPCDGIYNNHIIANCLRSVRMKKFRKLVNNW